ncbi:uncharacterized protein B0H18DRAFT_211913 [Fomitopsis serialis]|uniref:uncharacterized protein n=1 Tax=Fomitopsis serialis TaxID=139415 RepID=UPI00200826BC|nr:uncharacterized protein B0H18DRAFT_211913 [Neoantrodia serialis]KAH9929445.1 hypothetical protein B0H18DRAFT_211913 [Neoantrodia serialis]
MVVQVVEAASPIAPSSGAIFGSSRPRARTPSNPKPISPSQPAASPDHPMQTRVRKLSEAKKTPARRQASVGDQVNRPDSPDLDTILANTPRPRRRSSVAVSPSTTRSRTSSVASPFGWRVSGTDQDGTELRGSDDDLRGLEGDDGSESDSSIDLHTPLPHLMFRDGLLSPRSKLLPQVPGSPFPFLLEEDEEGDALDRSKSVLSVVSNVGSVMTKSGLLYKDPRDTVRRRRRHRDGQLLRAGMGLTTGLGWSDSEDEDAPSTLTRRLIHTSISRKPSSSISRPASEFSRDVASPAPVRPTRRKPGTARSASLSITSLSSLGRPGTAGSNSSTESQPVSHTRAQSTAVGTPPTASSLPMPSPPSSVSMTVPRARLPKSTEVKAALSRVRTDSTGTFGGKARSASVAVPTASALRSRTTSTTSSASTGSVYSSSSAYSSSGSSTQSAGSTTSTGVIPRPLRLPQSSALSRLSQPSSELGSMSSLQQTLGKGKPPGVEPTRPRTISMSRSTGSISYSTGPRPRPLLSPPQPYTPRSPTRTPTDSPRSPSPGTSLSSRSPSPRARPLVAGPRPKPRTGTGMMYRTSSYSSLQATAMRMRTMSTVAPPSSGVLI